MRVGYRRPNFKFSESKGKTLLLDVEVISNKFTLLIEDLKEREKKKSKNDDKTSKDAISETLTKTGLNKVKKKINVDNIHSFIHFFLCFYFLLFTNKTQLVMEEKLGKGQYGEVYKASHKNLAIPIAVKMIRNYDELAIKELQILK